MIMNCKLRCLLLGEIHNLTRLKTFRAFHKSAKVRSKQLNWSYWHNPGKEPLRAITVGNLLNETVDKFGDAEALVSLYQNRRLTYQQASLKINELAAGFISLGLKPGDRVGLLEPNSEEWYITFLAGVKAGLVMMNLNPANSASEIAHCLRLTNARVLITKDNFKTQNYYELISSFMPKLERTASGSPVQSKDFPEFSHLIINSSQTFAGAYRLEDIFSLANKESMDQLNKISAQVQPDDLFNIQFTSGTTGTPKAAALTHFNMLTNAYYTGKRLSYDKKRHVICCSVPLFHAYGTLGAVLCGLHYGTTIVLPSPSYSPEHALEAIINEQCTVLYGTPTMHIDMASLVEQNANIGPKLNIELILTGGATMLPEVYDRIKKTFPSADISAAYGLTESSASIFFNLPTDSESERKHTVGFLQDHVEVKVVDRAGKMVPFGTPGELWCRGWMNMLGYYNEPSKTAEMIRQDRWLKTGDEVILSENGYAQVVGRIKDMIIRGGENISPKEIESFISSHPDTSEVQVFGVTDERMGEEIAAAIVLKAGKSLREDDIKNFCKGNISHYKIPKYVQFVTELPKTSSGKIQKHVLRKNLEQVLKENSEEKIEMKL